MSLAWSQVGRRPSSRVVACLMWFWVASAAAEPARVAVDVDALLPELAARFSWSPIEAQACIVQIDVTGGSGGSWHIVPLDGGDVDLRPGPHSEAGFTCELAPETLGRLHAGELNGITAAGKDNSGGSSPVEVLPGTRISEYAPRDTLGPVFHFLTHFFNRDDPERFLLDRSAARQLHGAHMVGLFYDAGFRSAWYSIESGERLNEDGDTTPYPQAFVVLEGKARIRLGQRWVDVDEGEAVYVPAGTLHAVESRDGSLVELLWMAWGDGA